MDITETLAPKSDQLDAVDLLGGPQTFTVERVSKGSAEQPVQVHLAEFPRVWRPSKGMRRVLAACWGTKSDLWAGRRVRLYCDPDVKFGNDRVGGTRIAAVSHIDKPMQVPMIISARKSAVFTVQPLTDEPAPASTPSPTPEQIAECADVDTLRDWYRGADEWAKAAITARVAELKEQS